VAVGSLVFGDRVESADDNADLVADGGLGMAQDPDDPVHAYEMRGTFVLCLVFLGAFVITYLLNWYLLTQLWSIGA